MLCHKEFEITMNERKELILTYARRRGTFYEKNFEKLLLDKVNISPLDFSKPHFKIVASIL